MLDSLINRNYPNYEYIDVNSYFNLINNKDIIIVLNELLRDLDCTKLIKDGRQIQKTTDNRYLRTLYLFIRCMLRIENPFIYNNVYESLLKVHNNNIEFEKVYKEPIIKKEVKGKQKRKKVENKFIRSITYDMFSKEPKYIYWNPKTNEEIISSDENLLEELNKPKQKLKKTKIVNVAVPSSIIYKFK